MPGIGDSQSRLDVRSRETLHKGHVLPLNMVTDDLGGRPGLIDTSLENQGT